MSDAIETANILEGIAEWVGKVAGSDACLPSINDHRLPNVEDAAGLAKFLKWKAGQVIHPARIMVYRAVNGWQTKLMVWDNDGFYDVATTGMGPYGHDKKGYDMACAEGKSWAEDEGIEFMEPPGFEPLKEGEPSNLVECLQKLCSERGQELLIVELDKANGQGDPALGVLCAPERESADGHRTT